MLGSWIWKPEIGAKVGSAWHDPVRDSPYIIVSPKALPTDFECQDRISPQLCQNDFQNLVSCVDVRQSLSTLGAVPYCT